MQVNFQEWVRLWARLELHAADTVADVVLVLQHAFFTENSRLPVPLLIVIMPAF